MTRLLAGVADIAYRRRGRMVLGWIAAAIVLWVASLVLGGPSGTRLRHARELAEKLAAEGDQPSPELHRAVTDRVALVLNYASFACVVAILVLMIFKPGAG
jgi:uncharacterized membrane protein